MDRPGVGIAVYIRKGDKVLLGLRKGHYGGGTWCPPGGKLDMNESWEDCARRETKEEAGIEIDNLRFMSVTNDISTDVGTHYITLHFVADWVADDAQLLEPDKCERWEWFDWNDLPTPLFLPAEHFVATGITPFD